MQDLPKLFGSGERVGVTIFDRRWAFSANKNNLADAAAKHTAGAPAESGATAESDFYLAGRIRLAEAGMKVTASEERLIRGVPLTSGPRVLLRPSFALTIDDARSKISGGSVAEEATLVLDGEGIRLENVELAGRAGLVVKACAGANVTVKNLLVDNDGFELIPLSDEELQSESTPEYLRIRGYRIENRGAKVCVFTEPGEYVVDR